MIRKLSIYSLMVAATLGAVGAASAQGPAGGSGSGGATIPGSEVRAGETRRLNSDPSITTGSSNVTPATRDPATGAPIRTDVAPGGAVGNQAPSAQEAAPAGR